MSALTILRNPTLGAVARLTLGGLFLWASATKLTDPIAFSHFVYNFHVVPASLINVVAITNPWLEFVCGVLLLIGLFERGAALNLAVLLIGYSAGIAYNIAIGRSIDCGCFGASGAAPNLAVMWRDLARDLGMLALAAVVIVGRGSRWGLSSSAAPRTDSPDAAAPVEPAS